MVHINIYEKNFDCRITAEESREYWRLKENQTIEIRVNASSSKIWEKEDILPAETYVYIYTFLVSSIFIIGFTRSTAFYAICLKSSQRLHDMVFKALIQTSMRFFDTNPSGRILNRFSKDMGAIDELLPKAILDAAQIILSMFGALIVSCIVNPLLLIPIGVISFIFYWIRKIYLKTSKNIKRLEGISKSFIMFLRLDIRIILQLSSMNFSSSSSVYAFERYSQWIINNPGV